MRLFYTGASEDGATQTEPIKSIGGFVSGSKVPSGLEGSIFANPSQSEIRSGGVNYILLSLKNTTGVNLVGVKIYYEQADDALYLIEMGLISPALNSCGDSIYELESNNRAEPLEVTFTDAKGTGLAISIPTLAADEHIGVWIKRTINPDAADAYLSCANLYLAHEDDQDPAAKREFPFDVKIYYYTSTLITGGIDANWSGTMNFTQVGGIGIQTPIVFVNGEATGSQLDYFHFINNPNSQEYVVTPLGLGAPTAANLTFTWDAVNTVVLS
jgi:hypothetical protein